MTSSEEAGRRLADAVRRVLETIESRGMTSDAALLPTMAALLHRLQLQKRSCNPAARQPWVDFHQRPRQALEHILEDVSSELRTPIEVPTLHGEEGSLLHIIDAAVRSLSLPDDEGPTVDLNDIIARFRWYQSTPPSIASMMANALAPRPGDRLLDPAFGTGDLLLASLEVAARTGMARTPLRTTGIERNQWLASLAKLHTALRGHPEQTLITGDAFVVTRDLSEPKFDGVISNPPVLELPDDLRRKLGDHPAFRFGPPLRTSDLNFIQLAVSGLKPGGTAVLLVRTTPLFASGKEREIREALLKANCVSAVVSLALKLLPNTSAQCAMLLLRAPSPSHDARPVKLVAADTEFSLDGRGKRILTSENQSRILSALHSPHPQPGFSIIKTVEDLGKRDYSLVPMHHLLAERVPVNLGESTVMARIDEVAQIIRGPALGGLPPGEEPIVQGRDLPLRHIYKEELERKELPGDQSSLVTAQLNDILVQRIGASPKSHFVDQHLVGVPVSDTAYVVRLNDPRELVARFVVQFLNSETGQRRLAGTVGGAFANTLSKSALSELEIPFPEPEVMKLALELDELEGTLHEHVEAASDLKSRLFGVSRPDLFTSTFNSLRTHHRILKESLPGSGNLGRLNAAVGIAALEDAVKLWGENYDRGDEAFWHEVLDQRPFLFEHVFHYPIVIVQNKAYVGGKRLDNRHGSVADVLARTRSTGAALIIEIKNPRTKLLGKEYRQDVYPLSHEISGAQSQVLHYQSTLTRNVLQLREDVDDQLESNVPRCIVIAGNVARELDTRAKRRSFDHLRDNLHGISILGFDELFERAHAILQLLTSPSNGD
jgi:type I restriction-modification system DNA methylase subunit